MSRTIKRKKTGPNAVSHICRNNDDCTYCNKNKLQNRILMLNLEFSVYLFKKSETLHNDNNNNLCLNKLSKILTIFCTKMRVVAAN